MQPKEAEFWVAMLDTLLIGHPLVSVMVHPMFDHRPDIRVNQAYKSSDVITHKDGTAVVAIHDSYGVITGVEHLDFDLAKLQINMEWTNGQGEKIQFAYVLMDEIDLATYEMWRVAMRQSWKL